MSARSAIASTTGSRRTSGCGRSCASPRRERDRALEPSWSDSAGCRRRSPGSAPARLATPGRALRGGGAARDAPAPPSAIASDGTLARLELPRRPVTRPVTQVLAGSRLPPTTRRICRVLVARSTKPTPAGGRQRAQAAPAARRPRPKSTVARSSARCGPRRRRSRDADASYLLVVSDRRPAARGRVAGSPRRGAGADRRRRGRTAARRAVRERRPGDPRGPRPDGRAGWRRAVGGGDRPRRRPRRGRGRRGRGRRRRPGRGRSSWTATTVEALGRLAPADLREPLELGARIRALGRAVPYVGESIVEVAPDGPAEPVDAGRPRPGTPGGVPLRAARRARTPPHRWLGRPAGSPSSMPRATAGRRVGASSAGSAPRGLDAHAVGSRRRRRRRTRPIAARRRRDPRVAGRHASAAAAAPRDGRGRQRGRRRLARRSGVRRHRRRDRHPGTKRPTGSRATPCTSRSSRPATSTRRRSSTRWPPGPGDRA